MVGAAACIWYGVESSRSDRWPGGASAPGLAFGVAGGLIIVFEMLLWLRKTLRVVRIGRAKLWLKAHIWLGLLCVPLLVLHSGFRVWGVSLATVLMQVLLAVVVSGLAGVALQQYLPKIMLDGVPAETIRSQIPQILAQFLDEAERAVRVTCGKDLPAPVGASAARRDTEKPRSFMVIGAVRSSGPFHGKSFQTRAQATRVAGTEPLFEFYEETVVPYLLAKNGSRMPLASTKRAAQIFEQVRIGLDPAAHGVVNLLADFCGQRRQFDLQARLHAWLHGWLCIHVPLSVAVFVLMIAHVYYAWNYF